MYSPHLAPIPSSLSLPFETRLPLTINSGHDRTAAEAYNVTTKMKQKEESVKRYTTCVYMQRTFL
jgi:hypothetical protein